MEWSKENILNFIEIYHTKTIIWDPQDPDHFNKIKKEDAWIEIANEVGKPVDLCKKKMENLLASLRREKMKMKKSTGTGTGTEDVYKSNWFAFKSLQFILDKNKTKPSLNTMHLREDEEASPQEETRSTVDNEVSSKADDPASHDKESNSTAETPRIKRIIQTQGNKRKIANSTPSSDSERLDQAFQVLQASANQINANQDECYFFGNFVASKLRAYDALTRSAIENDIMNIFQMANQRYNISCPRLPHIPQTVVNSTILSENYSNNPDYSHLSYNSQNTSIHNSQDFPPTVPLPRPSTSSEMSHSSYNSQAYDSENLSPSPISPQVLSPNDSTYSDGFNTQHLV